MGLREQKHSKPGPPARPRAIAEPNPTPTVKASARRARGEATPQWRAGVPPIYVALSAHMHLRVHGALPRPAFAGANAPAYANRPGASEKLPSWSDHICPVRPPRLLACCFAACRPLRSRCSGRSIRPPGRLTTTKALLSNRLSVGCRRRQASQNNIWSDPASRWSMAEGQSICFRANAPRKPYGPTLFPPGK